MGILLVSRSRHRSTSWKCIALDSALLAESKERKGLFTVLGCGLFTISCFRFLYMVPMWPCPRLAADISSAELWALISSAPEPRIIPGLAPADFVAEFGRQEPGGGATFEFAQIAPSGQRYMLANPGPSSGHTPQSTVFSELPLRYPLPPPLRTIDLTPMVSVGLNGTGQTDLARHYHGITAMRLLQGRKIWALRPPLDGECMQNHGSCTDPFDVCAFYARPDAPAPACVQEAGDTIIIPDGWHHGTCNAAGSWTVGWGGQGRRLPLLPPRSCFHCRPASRHHFVTSEEPVLSAALAHALAGELQRSSSGARRGRVHAAMGGGAPGLSPPSARAEAIIQAASGVAVAQGDAAIETLPLRGQPILLAFRGLFMQFLEMPMDEAVRIPSFMDPECFGMYFAPIGVYRGDRPTSLRAVESQPDWARWLRSKRHVYAYAALSSGAEPADPFANATQQLVFRHTASGELEARPLTPLTAAMWSGDALHELRVGAYRVGVFRSVLDGVPDSSTQPPQQPLVATKVAAPAGVVCRIVAGDGGSQ